MESLNSKKFKTLEPEQMKKVVGGTVQLTYETIWTYNPQGSHWDPQTYNDSPPGPITT